MVRTLTRDESIDTCVTGLGDHIARTSRDDPDARGPFGPTRNESRTSPQCVEDAIELECHRFPGKQAAGRLAPGTDGHPTVAPEPALNLEPQPLSQYCVVPDLGMNIQRYMCCIQWDIMIHQRRNPA